MKLVVFGLSISSSCGNGHATLWRGLCRALHAMGHDIVFYERDLPLYASNRDLLDPPYCEFVLYDDFGSIRERAAADVATAGAAVVTSYFPDALAASELVIGSSCRARVFYDLDTPVTLERLAAGKPIAYVGPRGYADFDLVLSFTGGAAVDALVSQLGAKLARPLYGCVDPDTHFPAHVPAWSCDCSYLGTYSSDRQPAVDSLFVEPARRLQNKPFILGGSMYPPEVVLPPNVRHVEHVAPPEHSAFYGSSSFTVNVTRGAMAKYGFCPSERLFEAAACGTPILTDAWEGLERFFEPGREIVVVTSSEDVERALGMSGGDRARIATAARRRVLARHTATTRAHELATILADVHGAAFVVENRPQPNVVTAREV